MLLHLNIKSIYLYFETETVYEMSDNENCVDIILKKKYETSTELLELESESSISDSEDEVMVDEIVSDRILNRLTKLVRSQYCSYLEKLIKDNYESCRNQQSTYQEDIVNSNHIQHCALQFERRAMKACMIAQFYRNYMLKMITQIKEDTKSGILIPLLKKYEKFDSKLMNKSVLVECGTQTEEFVSEDSMQLNLSGVNEMRYECLTLQEKIQFFQDKLDDRERMLKETKLNNEDAPKRVYLKRKLPKEAIKSAKRSSCETLQDCSTPISVITDEELLNKPIEDSEDIIAKEMETLFGEESEKPDDIFGDGSYNPQIDLILKEIELAELPKHTSDSVKKETIQIESVTNINNKMKDEEVNFNLCDSLWPCELHMRQKRLRDILFDGAGDDIRSHEMIKLRFLELFGEDSEDEFAPYSPTLELNDDLIASCKKRIAPLVVKYLMKPMKDGLIGNRFLFKKLAKRLAHSIILNDQYPDEDYIKAVIADYFCIRKSVNSIDDII